MTLLYYGSTASILEMDKRLGMKGLVDCSVILRGNNKSSRKLYFNVRQFPMKRISNPTSKNCIVNWMKRDYAFIIYTKLLSQVYSNIKGRFTMDHSRKIKEQTGHRLISMG